MLKQCRLLYMKKTRYGAVNHKGVMHLLKNKVPAIVINEVQMVVDDTKTVRGVAPTRSGNGDYRYMEEYFNAHMPGINSRYIL